MAGRTDFSENDRVSVAELSIAIDRERVSDFCRARGIRKLSFFGLVLRSGFDPARSDVGVLAEFAPGVRCGLKLLGCGDELAETSASTRRS